MMLDGDPTILELAREVSAALAEVPSGGAIIGGLAVVLHGHLRTTRDVDVYTPDPAALAAVLMKRGFRHDATRREFVKGAVPVHLVTTAHVPSPPNQIIEIDGVRTVSLADLINLKLRSGTTQLLRAQDLADVIGLIRHHGLTGAFTSRLDADLRAEFRRLVKAIAAES